MIRHWRYIRAATPGCCRNLAWEWLAHGTRRLTAWAWPNAWPTIWPHAGSPSSAAWPAEWTLLRTAARYMERARPSRSGGPESTSPTHAGIRSWRNRSCRAEGLWYRSFPWERLPPRRISRFGTASSADFHWEFWWSKPENTAVPASPPGARWSREETFLPFPAM